MSKLGQLVARGQVCKAFSCKRKKTCIFYGAFCEFQNGCPQMFSDSICRTCDLENMCIYKKRGV